MLTNQTPFVIADQVQLDRDGVEVLVIAVKGTFAWEGGVVTPASEPVPIQTAEVFDGEDPNAGLLAASDVGLAKPRVDILVEGEIALAAPVEAIDCVLEVGARLKKVVRVFGPRFWVPGNVRPMVPSRPQPFSTMPISWSRSFGGADAKHPSVYEPRNPAGSGVIHRSSDLEGRPAPNFEDPRATLDSGVSRPAPVGFGPVAAHWKPRSDFAGTYDQRWQEDRFPLLPRDFDDRFLNVAPLDQQLDGYLAGEEVRLTWMSPSGRDRFPLPAFALPVTFIDDGYRIERTTRVDTVVVFPAERRFTVLSRVVYQPRRNILAISDIMVGAMNTP